MKIVLKFILLFQIVLLIACGGKNKESNKVTTIWKEYTTDSTEIKIDSEEITKLKDVYFFNLDVHKKDWTMKGYMRPKEDSEVIALFDLGDTIPVIEEINENWLAVYVALERRKRDTFRNRAYIKRSDLGDIKNLLLTADDFRTVRNEEDPEKSYLISEDTLLIELISKNEFEAAKQNLPIAIEEVKHGVKIKEGSVSLVCGAKIVNLKDKNPITDSSLTDEEILTYSYEGFHKGMNSYLVKHKVWESGGYDFYKQATGEVIASTTEYPVFSPNKEIMADLWGNAYDEHTELRLQKKSETGKYEPLLSLDFTMWTPLKSYSGRAKEDYFWGEDDALYIRTIITKAAGTGLNSREDIVQYIKIRINI